MPPSQKECPPPDDTLVFVHIAKTAGSTFNFLLERNFFGGSCFGAYDTAIPPTFRSSTGVFEPAVVFDHMRNAEIERGTQFRFISGHMRFGLHEYLDRPCTYITFVRDPVERIVSAFNYVRSLGWLEESVSLSEFVDMDLLGNSDAMVRQLVNDPSLDTTESPALLHHARSVTEADFEQACQNLQQHFAVAAPLEGFDYALLLLAQHFQWPLKDLVYRPANVSPKIDTVSDLDSETRDKIIQRNHWDFELYQKVVAHFEKRLSAIQESNKDALMLFTRTMQAYRAPLEPPTSGSKDTSVAHVNRTMNAIQSPLGISTATPVQRPSSLLSYLSSAFRK